MGFPVVSNESFIGYGYIIRDITREKEVDSLKDSILSTVSHELRTPLTTIRGCAESLLRKGIKWNKIEKEEFLTAIVDESKLLRELIENIMDMSKIEAGALNLDIHDVDIKKLIERIVSGFRKKLHSENIIVEFVNEIPFVQLDERRIEQVLSNLLENGIKYSQSEAQIMVRIEYVKDEELVKVSVIDHGIGIDEQHHDVIFERFYRINTPLTNKVRGSGVGLSIAKGIIEAHGGNIWVESQAGSGTEFTFTIPCKNN
jgi:signal transduction histidine kinase